VGTGQVMGRGLTVGFCQGSGWEAIQEGNGEEVREKIDPFGFCFAESSFTGCCFCCNVALLICGEMLDEFNDAELAARGMTDFRSLGWGNLVVVHWVGGGKQTAGDNFGCGGFSDCSCWAI